MLAAAREAKLDSLEFLTQRCAVYVVGIKAAKPAMSSSDMGD